MHGGSAMQAIEREHPERSVGEKATPIIQEIVLGIPGMTDLMEASYKVDAETVKLALELGDNPDQEDSQGNTASMYLCAGREAAMAYFYKRYFRRDQFRKDLMSFADEQAYNKLTHDFCSIVRMLSNWSS